MSTDNSVIVQYYSNCRQQLNSWLRFDKSTNQVPSSECVLSVHSFVGFPSSSAHSQIQRPYHVGILKSRGRKGTDTSKTGEPFTPDMTPSPLTCRSFNTRAGIVRQQLPSSLLLCLRSSSAKTVLKDTGTDTSLSQPSTPARDSSVISVPAGRTLSCR